MRKSKTKRFKVVNYKGLSTSISYFMAHVLLVIVAAYLFTDYAMTTTDSTWIQYFYLTPKTAAYWHHQLTLPFCVSLIIFILPSLKK